MSWKLTSAVVAGAAVSVVMLQPAARAQQPPAGQTPPAGQPPAAQAGARQGGGGGRGNTPMAFDDFTGFEKIFDGTLKNWDGNPEYWRAEGNEIVGETTADKALTENTFLIYRGSEPDNFELKLEFRINSTNSGVQYRSKQVTGAVNKWVLCGYQADIDFDNNYTGMLYEERGRSGFLSPRGTINYAPPTTDRQGQCSENLPVAPRGQGAAPGGAPGAGRGQGQPAQGGDPAARGAAGGGGQGRAAGAPAGAPAGPRRYQIGTVEDGASLKQFIKVNDWNQFHVIARGNTLIHVMNGHVTQIFIDDDQTNRSMKGLIGLQIHVGPPMKVQFRNLYIKNLK
jgi:hypothetical protein